MKIYLVRHGESTPAENDDIRPLSDKGKLDIKKLANFIATFKIKVTNVFQSEKLRAQQTAKILLSSIEVTGSIETYSSLDPDASPNIIMDEIYAAQCDALLVGHMPFMGKLVAKLITGNENNNVVYFKPGSMLCLEQIGNQQWIICWMLNPELFN